MASRAVSLTFHSDGISANPPPIRRHKKWGLLGLLGTKIAWRNSNIFLIVGIIINSASVKLTSYKFRRYANFEADWIDSD